MLAIAIVVGEVLGYANYDALEQAAIDAWSHAVIHSELIKALALTAVPGGIQSFGMRDRKSTVTGTFIVLPA